MLCERSVFWSATLAHLYFGLSVSRALRHSRKAELPESVAKTTCEPSCPTFPGILKRSPAPKAPCDPRRLEPQLPRPLPPCAATPSLVALAPPSPRAAPAPAAHRAQRTNARPKAHTRKPAQRQRHYSITQKGPRTENRPRPFKHSRRRRKHPSWRTARSCRLP